MSVSDPDLLRDELGRRVRSAVLEMVGDESYDDVTVRDLAVQLGVEPEEMYRRWPSKPDLLVDVVRSFLSGLPSPDTGDVRKDLIIFTNGWMRELYGPLRPLQYAVITRIHRAPEVAEAYGVIGRYLREVLERIIRRGITRGQLPEDARVGLGIEILRARWAFRFIMGEVLDTRVAEETINCVILPILCQGSDRDRES